MDGCRFEHKLLGQVERDPQSRSVIRAAAWFEPRRSSHDHPDRGSGLLNKASLSGRFPDDPDGRRAYLRGFALGLNAAGAL